MTIPRKAVYSHGSFVPERPLDLPEGAEVILTVQRSGTITPPSVRDPEERRRILNALAEQMLARPLSANAPRPAQRAPGTRSCDALHERR